MDKSALFVGSARFDLAKAMRPAIQRLFLRSILLKFRPRFLFARTLRADGGRRRRRRRRRRWFQMTTLVFQCREIVSRCESDVAEHTRNWNLKLSRFFIHTNKHNNFIRVDASLLENRTIVRKGKKKGDETLDNSDISLFTPVWLFLIFTLPPFTSNLNTPARRTLFVRSNYGVPSSLYVTFAHQPRTPDRHARKIPASERNYVIGEKRSFLVASTASKIRHCSVTFSQFFSLLFPYSTIDVYCVANISTENFSTFTSVLISRCFSCQF